MRKFTLHQIKREKGVWKKVSPWVQTYLFLFLEAVFIFFIVSLLLFVLVNLVYEELGRSNFLQAESGSKTITEAKFRIIENKYSLLGSYGDRYLVFLEKFWDGSLLSFRIEKGAEVGIMVGPSFLTSFKLGILGLIVGVVLGTIVGLLAGRKPGGWFDKIVSSYIIVVLSFPLFVTGLVVQLLAYNTGNFNIVYNEYNVVSWLLPIFTLAIPVIATYARYLKTTVGEELSSNYINLAKSKGVSSLGISFKHILKPSLYPLVTNLPFAVLFTFTGAIVTESVFAIDGAGSIYLRAIADTDIWVLMYLSMIYTLISLVAFVIRDMSYPLIDPQAKVDLGLLRRD